MIHRTRRLVDSRRGLIQGMNNGQQSKIRPVHIAIDRIALEGDHVVDIGGRIGESALPNALRIGGPHPWPMILAIDYPAQRNSGAFHDADVLAEVHKKHRIGRQGFEKALD